MSNKPRIIYVAPDMRTIQRFVEMVYSQLASSQSINLQKQEVIRGLVQFLVLIAQFEAEQRNSQGQMMNNNQDQIE